MDDRRLRALGASLLGFAIVAGFFWWGYRGLHAPPVPEEARAMAGVPIAWKEDLDEAREEAAASGKLLLLFLSLERRSESDRIELATTSEAVRGYVNTFFVPLRIPLEGEGPRLPLEPPLPGGVPLLCAASADAERNLGVLASPLLTANECLGWLKRVREAGEPAP